MSTIEPNKIIHEEPLRGGQMWSRIVRRGQVLRVTNTEGGATPAGLFYNADQPLERYNMPDSLKAQHTAHLTTGHVLYSDMGRVLMSVIDDSAGWHDTVTGHLTRERSDDKYGQGAYQALRNDFHRNSRDNFLVELGKHGMGLRDIVPNVNFFTRLNADADGALSWVDGAPVGSHVDLRAEMDVLAVLSNTPHPLDPTPEYRTQPVALTLWQAPPVAADDVCRTLCEQNARGFTLTEQYQL